MRIPKLENYRNDTEIEYKNMGQVPKTNRYIFLNSEKQKKKFILTLERVVRSSLEYKEYIAYLNEYIDMRQCSFFTNVNKREKNKISIEIHHEPFTLFDITKIVVEKWVVEGIPLNVFLMAEEIMKIHYQNKVGLIPLSKTVHKLVHAGKLFIPLQNVRGKFVEFFQDYEPYIDEELKDKLQIQLKMSQEVEMQQNLSILEKKYVYLEVDGMVFPETLDEIVDRH